MNKNEYAPYFETYISYSKNMIIPDDFSTQMESCMAFFESVPVAKLDCERIFQYRALRISRSDKTPLPGFEENDYAVEANATSRTLESLLNEYKSVRKATFTLFETFSEEQLLKMGNASGKDISVRAIGYIILGHELHHIKIIKERYL